MFSFSFFQWTCVSDGCMQGGSESGAASSSSPRFRGLRKKLTERKSSSSSFSVFSCSSPKIIHDNADILHHFGIEVNTPPIFLSSLLALSFFFSFSSFLEQSIRLLYSRFSLFLCLYTYVYTIGSSGSRRGGLLKAACRHMRIRPSRFGCMYTSSSRWICRYVSVYLFLFLSFSLSFSSLHFSSQSFSLHLLFLYPFLGSLCLFFFSFARALSASFFLLLSLSWHLVLPFLSFFRALSFMLCLFFLFSSSSSSSCVCRWW